MKQDTLRKQADQIADTIARAVVSGGSIVVGPDGSYKISNSTGLIEAGMLDISEIGVRREATINTTYDDARAAALIGPHMKTRQDSQRVIPLEAFPYLLDTERSGCELLAYYGKTVVCKRFGQVTIVYDTNYLPAFGLDRKGNRILTF